MKKNHKNHKVNRSHCCREDLILFDPTIVTTITTILYFYTAKTLKESSRSTWDVRICEVKNYGNQSQGHLYTNTIAAATKRQQKKSYNAPKKPFFVFICHFYHMFSLFILSIPRHSHVFFFLLDKDMFFFKKFRNILYLHLKYY